MPHAFISYVHDDSESVERLVAALKAAGVEVWLDRERLDPGVRWQEAIRRAIEDGMFFIACFSEHSERRERSYMREEIILAIDELRRRSRDRAWFLPVLLTPDSMPRIPIGAGETLHDIQYVSLFDNWADGLLRLLRVVCREVPVSTEGDDEWMFVADGASPTERTRQNPIGLYSARAFPDLRSYLDAIARGYGFELTAEGLEGLASRIEASEFVRVSKNVRDDWPGRPPQEVLDEILYHLRGEVLLRSSDYTESGWFFEDAWHLDG